MSKKIYKYPLALTHSGQVFDLQGDVKFIGKEPSGGLAIWAEHDDDVPAVPHTFFIVGTGNDIVPDTEYCGSILDGPFVWHIYSYLTELVYNR